MTNLPVIERKKFFEALTQFIAASRNDESTIGILLIDIVNLADINHSHSYAEGDLALQHCYVELLSVSRIANTVFRIGDRHFAFILPELKTPAFIALAISKISKLLQGQIIARPGCETLADTDNCADEDNAMETVFSNLPKGDTSDVRAKLNIKIGVAINENAQFNSEKTLLIAEGSLKNSKANKGSFSIPKPGRAISHRTALEAIFANKIKANDFELYYQPKVNLKTGKTDRAEALLRWKTAEEGYISPEIAVDIAQRTGQGFALTKWVVHTAIYQMKQWEEQNVTISVAVNVPADLIQHPELFHLVRDALTIWGVDKNRLTLEITESAFIEDKEAGFNNLLKLKEFGVKLSIDDFGTGYSSLSYFKHIPANELKIDKSFVLNMLNNTQDQHIVKIIIELARLFDLTLVAEGIEDQRTYEYLKQLGCDYGQGYHMAKPMPPEKFIHYLEQQNTSGN